MSAWILPIAEAIDPARAGGKAHGLARMLALGLPVPEGFLLTNDAFQAFLARDRLGERIDGLLDRLDARDTARMREVSEHVRELVLAAESPPSLRSELLSTHHRLPAGEPIIVRSSAVGEDSARTSFAGQLDSCPDVHAPEELEPAVRACWASYWSERVLAYQLGRGAALAGMGVVLQRQVRARLSGVLFTRAPDGTGDAMLGEYCYGPGEALVSGQIDPGRFTLSRDGAEARHLASPEPASLADDAALFKPALMAALAAHARRLEGRLGGPQDIEWTVDSAGRLFLVQSRPITTPTPTPTSTRRVVWSNANINENFPGPVTPFLASIVTEGYTHYFRNLARAFGVSPKHLARMEPHLRQIAGLHGARLYYHLTNIHSVLRFAPGGDALAAYFDRFVGAPADGEDRAPGRAGLLSLLRIALFTTWKYAFLERRVRAFERRADAFAERTHPDALAGKSLVALRDDLRAFLDIRFHRWTGAGLADVAAMVCHGVLERLLHQAFPNPAQQALHNTLLKGLCDLASCAPVQALWELSRQVRADPALRRAFAEKSGAELLAEIRSGRFSGFDRALDDYLDRYGFRGSGELMLTTPSFQEDPAGLLELLARYVGLEGPSPSEQLRRQRLEREEATARIRTALGARGRVVSLALRWTQAAVVFRERARTKQALLYSRLRRVTLAMGAKLAKIGALPDAGAVLFLTYPELDQLLSGRAPDGDVWGLIRARKEEHGRQSTLDPPDRLVLPEGEIYSRRAIVTPGAAEAPPAALTGIGTCGGRVTGRAAVLRDLSAPDQLAAGDILVTRQTDPGWAPVFFLVKGLVMERGGMLSHGSILAREFGLPSVVGIRDATARIRSGQTITVDGDLGHVLLQPG